MPSSIRTPMMDALSPAGLGRRHPQSPVAQARRAMALVGILLVGMGGLASAASHELGAAPRGARAASADEAVATTVAAVRLDTTTLSAGEATVVLRASMDTTLRVSVLDGAEVLAQVTTPTVAGAPVRLPVTVAGAARDRVLAVQVEAAGQPSHTLAVRVPAQERVARAGAPPRGGVH